MQIKSNKYSSQIQSAKDTEGLKSINAGEGQIDSNDRVSSILNDLKKKKDKE